MAQNNASEKTTEIISEAVKRLNASRKGHISALTRYINRIPDTIHVPGEKSTAQKLIAKIEYSSFKITELTEKICDIFPDTNDQQRTLCSQQQERAREALQRCESYVEREQEIKRAKSEKSQSTSTSRKSTITLSKSSVKSKSTLCSSIMNQADRRIESRKAELIAVKERENAEQSINMLNLRRQQFEIQQQIAEAEVAAKLKDAEDKATFAKTIANLSELDLGNHELRSNNTFQELPIIPTEEISPHLRIKEWMQISENNTEQLIQPETEIITKKPNLKHIRPNTPLPSRSSSTKSSSSSTQEQNSKNIPTYIDHFIDELIEGHETVIQNKKVEESALTMFKAEYELKGLPPIELYRYSGNPSFWPDFIENFRRRVHDKVTFTDNIRMERLLSVLDGDARRTVHAIGQSGIFYPTALKTLKRDFGNPIVVSHSKLKIILDPPQLPENDKTAVRSFQQQLHSTVTWLKRMGYFTSIKSIENVTKAVKRLPNHLRNRFYKEFTSLNSTENNIDLEILSSWLDSKLKVFFNPIATIINGLEANNHRTEKHNNRDSSEKGHARTNNINTDQANQQLTFRNFNCWLCAGEHKISECASFNEKTVLERREITKNKGLCFNCLSNTHMVNSCQSKYNCKIDRCNRRHHTLLHIKEEKSIVDCNVAKVNKNTSKNSQDTFLQIIPVILISNNIVIKTNAILDTGSDVTLIRRDMAEELKLDGKLEDLNVSSALSDQVKFSSKLVNFQISPLNNIAFKEKITNAWVVDKLDVPCNKVRKEHLSRYKHLQNIKFPVLHDSEVTLLIGSDYPDLLLHQEFKRGEKGEPVAIRTLLGWVLMGGTKSNGNSGKCNFICENNMTEQIERFWKLDSYGTLPKLNRTILPPTQTRALNLLEKTTKFCNNRFEVGLLWKEDKPVLPFNRILAVKRLQSLERKFEKNENFRLLYHQEITEYIEKGYARKLTEEEAQRTPISNYIPHHGVFNINKPNKIRVVFDASAKFEGTSLNDNLLPGIDLLNNLVSVLHKFRQGEYAVMADIKAMFHQVAVSQSDADALRFVWREAKSTIDDYIMSVHIFGKVDSPCCANWALKKSAPENNLELKELIENNFYMDDLLYSNSDKELLIKLSKEVSEILSKHGFQLTKWLSNDVNLLSSIPKSDVSCKLVDMDLNTEVTERALGMIWDISHDTFKFVYKPKACAVSKRGILSLVASIFDPLGILTPCILEGKLIMQSLWKLSVDWDDPLPPEITQRFDIWKQDMAEFIGDITVDRWFGYSEHKGCSNIELHIFSDASTLAYGAVAYFKFEVGSSSKISFIMSKSRLAPIKEHNQTIPRLELQAAVVAVRIKDTIIEHSDYHIAKTTFWVDSEIVLKYIRNQSRKFPVFVMNRLNEIRLNSNINDWKFIPGKQNPADLCSRYIPFNLLRDNETWFTGPEIMEDNYEEIRETDDESISVAEVNSLTICNYNDNLKTELPFNPNVNWKRFSNFNNLLRSMAWVLKIIHNWLKFKHNKQKAETANLSTFDLNRAKQYLLKIAQSQSFSKEYVCLKGGNNSQHSRLVQMKPFLDSNDIIRVGGRIAETCVPFQSKHQVLLDKDHYLSELIVRYFHEKSFHAGRDHTLSLIREEYWILRGRGLIKRVLEACSQCKRNRVTPSMPIMGDLPRERLDIGTPAFFNTGVDYFGPILTKQNRRTRNLSGSTKRWGCLFTCLTTRAVHLELSNDLSTDSFLLALRRFRARRGNPRNIRSDNGTNFVGADRQIRVALKGLNQQKIKDDLSIDNVNWTFNPPCAPWMGGAMESLVKIVKKALKSVIKDRLFTDEALYTFMTEVESIVNSRPLTNVSDDIRDFTALTPNHFVMGRSSINMPAAKTDESDITLRSKWRAVQAASDMFWRRWMKEYLPALTVRRKWSTSVRDLSVGDLVLVVKENTKRSQWPLGRIIETYPSKDNVTRVVKISTNDGEFIRPVGKVALLEAAQD